jgi:hypothetical protein
MPAQDAECAEEAKTEGFVDGMSWIEPYHTSNPKLRVRTGKPLKTQRFIEQERRAEPPRRSDHHGCLRRWSWI